MIEVKELKKKYQDKEALKGINFKVNRGEIFGFLGPNGAGKTTTLKILTGQLQPTSGKAEIMGKDVQRDKDYIRPEIGVVPENTNLYERLTIGQNLELFCRLYRIKLANVDHFLKEVNLLEEKNTQVKKLSKGMKQRVLLVRALLHRPTVLFLDEPTSGLDPVSADGIHRLLVKLNNEGMTIMLTSHNMEEVDKLCHRVAFLDRGQIAAIGTPEELKLAYASHQMRLLVQTDNGLEEMVMDLAGDKSAELVSEWIRNGSLKSIHSCEPTLADIFMEVTGREFK